MNELTGRPTSGYNKIDHSGISNDRMPLYGWRFSAEANDEEIFAEPLEAEGGAKKRFAAELAEVMPR
jgi:hypothetical protein